MILYRGCDTKLMGIRGKAKRAVIKPWFNLMIKCPLSVSIALHTIPYQSCFVTSQYPSTLGVHTQIHTFATPTQRVIATYHVIPKCTNGIAFKPNVTLAIKKGLSVVLPRAFLYFVKKRTAYHTSFYSNTAVLLSQALVPKLTSSGVY